jgi:hypothetical protein
LTRFFGLLLVLDAGKVDDDGVALTQDLGFGDAGLSARSRIRSTARSRLDVLNAPTGCWVMEIPPCRSRPATDPR